LQNTTQLINRTQGRLSTGLAVASAIDDPVAFFQAKALSDRADDFEDKKSDIDQGISTLTAALDGAEGIENIVSQMKGLALSTKSATSSTIAELVSQFNDLRTQIANLAADTSYQGLNLINGTGSTLTVQFSTETTSTLAVASVDLAEDGKGLAVRQALTQVALTGSVLNVSYGYGTNVSLSDGGSLSVVYAGETARSLTAGSTLTFTYGTATVTVSVGSTGSTTNTFTDTQVLSANGTMTFTIASEGSGGTGNLVAAITGVNSAGGAALELTTVTGQYVIDSTAVTQINALVNDLDANLSTVRAKSQTLGSNVALLQTRLDFTVSYVNTLTTGADKLTLADLNEEGANLLALQTRQQLGISALSFAGQAEQGILALFR
jgi:flagellin-like hook-associated protein FlgL